MRKNIAVRQNIAFSVAARGAAHCTLLTKVVAGGGAVLSLVIVRNLNTILLPRAQKQQSACPDCCTTSRYSQTTITVATFDINLRLTLTMDKSLLYNLHRGIKT